MKRIERLPDAACEAFCVVRYKEGQSTFVGDTGNLVLILGMFAVNGRTVYVEIPFSDFAPEFTKVEDFDELVIRRHHKLLKDGKKIERSPNKFSRPSCDICPSGKMMLCVIGMFCIDSQRLIVRIPFSEFSKDFACVEDFEPLIIRFIDKLDFETVGRKVPVVK